METFKRLGLLINLLLFSFNLVSCGGGGVGNPDGGSPSTSVPVAPSGVLTSPGIGQVTINWNTVSGASSYNLYTASVSGVNKNNYGSLADGMKHTGVPNPFTEMGLTNGKTYYFIVTAVNSAGESVESQEVSAVPSGAAITISPASAALLINATQSFIVMANGLPTSAVTWSVQESNGGNIISSGLYTAPGTAGTYHVVATSQADSTKRAVATVIVSVPVVSVTVTPVMSAVTAGGNTTFSVAVTGTPNMAVTWSVQETNGGTIDSNGIYSAPNIPGGPYHVLATSQADTTKTSSALVNIYSLTKSLNATIMAVAVSPNYTNDRTVYAAGSNGLYVSGDGGTSWNNINTTITCGTSLAISPEFVTDRTLFVSGCAVYNGTTTMGILKSTDGGTTWTKVFSYSSSYAYPYGPVIARDIGLAYDSSHNLIVLVMFGGYFVAEQNVDIVRSGDGGNTWSYVNGYHDTQGIYTYVANSLVIPPDFGTYKTVYASFGLGWGTSWIDASYDGGITWRTISFYDNVPNGIRDSNGRTGLCITPSGVTSGVGISGTFEGAHLTLVSGPISDTLLAIPVDCSGGNTYRLDTYTLPVSSGMIWYPTLVRDAAVAGYFGNNSRTLFSGYSLSQDYGYTWESLSKSVSVGFWADGVAFSPDYFSDGVIFVVGGLSQPGLWRYTNLK